MAETQQFIELQTIFETSNSLSLDIAEKTYAPQLSKRAVPNELVSQLSALRLTDLKAIWLSFNLPSIRSASKEYVVKAVAACISWTNQDEFSAFMQHLPQWTREILERGAYEPYLYLSELETIYKRPFTKKKDKHLNYFGKSIELDESLGAFILRADSMIFLYPPIRTALRKFVPRPQAMIVPELNEIPSLRWSNEERLFESLELAIHLIKPVAKLKGSSDVRRGANKTQITSWRKQSGYDIFPIASGLGLDALELLARFMFAMHNKTPKKPQKDMAEYIKAAVEAFFEQNFKTSIEVDLYGPELEFRLLCDHLRQAPGRYELNYHYSFPRLMFKEALCVLAARDCWYRVDDLVRSCMLQETPLCIDALLYPTKPLTIKADAITIRGRNYEQTSYINGHKMQLTLSMYDDVVYTPLLKAYCYLLATLGLMEIAECEPPKPVVLEGNKTCISPYDALYAFRITNFGRFCLGISTSKPQAPAIVYEAIADKELPLIAYKGNSAEHKLFLNSIGEAIGNELFRVTDASFSSSCSSEAEVRERIKTFTRLIDPHPAAHWERLFASACAKMVALKIPELAYLYPVPKDPEILHTLLHDPGMKNLIHRVEGGYIAVKHANKKRFIRLANAAGFYVPDQSN